MEAFMANLLTVSQVAERTGASVATIRRKCERGEITGAHQSQIKIGNGYAWLIPETSIESITLVDAGKRSPIYGGKPKT
jgi:excisionase family DNA binding protein